MKYKVNHPTMKIEKDGNIINNSGVPVTSIKIVTNPANFHDFRKNIDIDTIVKIFKEVDWEYILGTGHWTPRLNDVVHITSDIIESFILELTSLWKEAPVNNNSLSKRLYSGISTYYYKFTLSVVKGKFSFKIEL